MRKVFGIGPGKTGTVSLTSAMRLLGFTATHLGVDSAHQNVTTDKESSMKALEPYEFATDYPIWVRWRELVEWYPDAKFILTTRDLNTMMRSWLFHACYCLERYNSQWGMYISMPEHRQQVIAHYAEVRRHFHDSPNFMQIDITTTKDPFIPLCNFLEVDHPGVPFPRENTKLAHLAFMLDKEKKKRAGRA